MLDATPVAPARLADTSPTIPSIANAEVTLQSVISLGGPSPCVGVEDHLSAVIEFFEKHSDCYGVLVLDGEVLASALSRESTAWALSKPYTRELFSRRPLRLFLRAWKIPTLELPEETDISNAIEQSLGRPAQHRYEPIVVRRKSGSREILDVHTLLLNQCRVLSATLLELDHQRQATQAAEREREHLHARLLEASREAGRAEVATGVLHNVGNVLNSINVSASLINRKLQQSKVGNLGRAAAMLREHESELTAFLTGDERGKQLPGYLIKLAELLGSEQNAIVDEMANLGRSLEHIKEVVSMQQAHAKGSAVLQKVLPAEIAEDALRVNMVSFERHNVKVVREFEDTGPANLDKHRILQILINLISNAKNAIKAGGAAEKQITIRIQAIHGETGGRVRFQIVDSGIGIPAENLTRIFSHGFSTWKGGHGFGLHSSANTAKELGGSLTADSQGPGTGAAFTLELPAKFERVSV